MEDLDLFSLCPAEIKFEIISYLNDVSTLCALSSVCKSWNLASKNDKIWKNLYERDFLWWDVNAKETAEDQCVESWKQKYAESHLKGWQWDPTCVNDKIILSNNTFSVHLSSGFTYHGVRTTRGESSGVHRFEVLIERLPNDRDNAKFDNGSLIYMGVGVASEKFNVHNCTTGWSHANNGIGYYNDGQIFAMGVRVQAKLSQGRAMAYKAGDRVGLEMDMDAGTVTFFVNGEQLTNPIGGLVGTHYPHVILANNLRNKVTITTGRKGAPKKSECNKVTEQTSNEFCGAVRLLDDMGFRNQDLCLNLLHMHKGDVVGVLNTLLE